jgi:hypothetical protein
MDDEVYFTHTVFENIEAAGERPDNYVIDVCIPYSVLVVERMYKSDIYSENSRPAIDQLGQEYFHDQVKGGREVSTFQSTPETRIESLEQLETKTELHLPDHTKDCLKKFPYRDEDIENILEVKTRSLPILDELGIEEYSTQALKEVEANRPLGEIEDEAVINAAEELPGQTYILTYDGGMIQTIEQNETLKATIPEIAKLHT